MLITSDNDQNYIIRRGIKYKKANEQMLKIALSTYRDSLSGKKEKLTDEQMQSELAALTEDGKLHLYKNIRLYKVLISRAHYHHSSIEEEIAKVGFTGYSEIVKSNSHGRKIAKETHLQNLRDCINEQGEIIGLSKNHPVTYGYMLQLSKKNNLPLENMINVFLGQKEGTYKYVKYSSVYDFSSPHFFADDPSVRYAVCEILESITDENKCIGYMQERAPQLYNIFTQIATRNDISMSDVVHLFLPDVEYGAPSGLVKGATIKHKYSDEDIAEILDQYDDGSGYVDSLHDNSFHYALIKRKSTENGIPFNEYVQKFGHKLALQYFGVDHEDYLRTMLEYNYGPAPCEIKNISVDNKQLYRRLKYFQHFYPGNVFPTTQAVLDYFGYHYVGLNSHPREYTLNEISDIIRSEYDAGARITGLWSKEKVWKPVMSYCSKHILSMKELFDRLGYKYDGTGVCNIRSKLYLAPDEYELYQKLSEQYAYDRMDNAHKKD